MDMRFIVDQKMIDSDEGLDSDEHEGDGADLGAKDGEEPWDEDDLHVEGYDEL